MSAVRDQILERIKSRGRGRVFIAKDFLHLANRSAVDQALSRLAKSNKIERLGRGLYIFPQLNRDNGIFAPADLDEIAEAVGRQTGSQVVPSGAIAASRLGLADQVTAKPVYLTDGRTRQIRIGKVLVQLRHAAPKELPAASRTSSMVFQALRHIGKEAVNGLVAERLRQVLSPEQRIELLRDAKYTTDWISAIVRAITKKDVGTASDV